MPIEIPARIEAPMERFDEAVDGWFDHLRGRPLADRVFYIASELGDWSLIWHLLSTAKGLGPAGPRTAWRTAAALGAESALVNGVVKTWFQRTRPDMTSERPHHLRRPKTSSFPSGHASSAFLAAALLSEDSRLKPLYYGAAVTVAASRVHVKIHHASDVVAGAVLGAGLARLTKRLGRRWPRDL